MNRIAVNDRQFPIEVVVFDKDGLLFDSMAFWIELAYNRLAIALEYMDIPMALRWLDLLDIDAAPGEDGGIRIRSIDPMGFMAVGSPDEEVIVTATFLLQEKKLRWPEARSVARGIHDRGDRLFDFERAIKPRPGFPCIFRRLRAAGIPYGIATSDERERARRSVNLFDDFSLLSFVLTPRDVERHKPEPDMLRAVCGKFGVEPQHVLMIGDSYMDMLMAQNAGCIGVGIPEYPGMREQMLPYATVIAQSLDDIVIVG